MQKWEIFWYFDEWVLPSVMLRNQFRKQTKKTSKNLHLNYRALMTTLLCVKCQQYFCLCGDNLMHVPFIVLLVAIFPLLAIWSNVQIDQPSRWRQSIEFKICLLAFFVIVWLSQIIRTLSLLNYNFSEF